MAIANKNQRIGTLNNLPLGATNDLLLILYPDGFPEGQIQFGIDVTPAKVTGIQKVAQTFLKLLMTTKGSDPFYTNRGTVFSEVALNSNNIESNAALSSDLSSAVKDAGAQTKVALNSSGDPASQLANVILLGIDTSEEAIVMYFQIVTNAGVTAQVAIPFPEFGLT